MSCELCDLVNGKDGFIITMCHTCNLPMIVSREHKDEFSEEEKALIKRMFPHSRIRWEQRRIKNHPHCHILKER